MVTKQNNTRGAATRPVVGIGEILWDFLPGGKKLGGTVANVAHHVHQLGAWAEIVSSVGDDALGVEACNTLRGLGFGTNYIAVVPGQTTRTVEVRTEVTGQPLYKIRETVAWDGVPITPALLALAAEARAICFGTLAQRSARSRATMRALVEATPPDALRVVDLNLRHQFHDRDVIVYSLNAAQVLKLNHEELAIVGRVLDLPSGEDAAVEALRSRYDLAMVALTRGGDGSVLYCRNQRDEHTGFLVNVADTVGAGDAFTAGLILGCLRGLPLCRIHAGAARVAAYVCTQAGGTPTLPAELRLRFAP